MAVSEKGFLLVGKMPPRPGGWDRIVVERGPQAQRAGRRGRQPGHLAQQVCCGPPGRNWLRLLSSPDLECLCGQKPGHLGVLP